MADEMPRHLSDRTVLVRVDAHINDAAFADAALAVFDDWVERGLIPRGMQ
jgi:uncharacterized protein (UPF0261 family)